ncbi:MAG: CHAT domain-containing protein [Phycisphaerae bacterium]
MIHRFLLALCLGAALACGCAKPKKPEAVQGDRTLSEAQRKQLERRRRRTEREAKDFASEPMRSLWDRYLHGRNTQVYDAVLEKRARQALTAATFDEASRQARLALDNFKQAYPTEPLASWERLPGTYEAWVQERNRRDLEDRNDPVGAELTLPAPLEIQDKRLLRLNLEVLVAMTERFTGKAIASRDRSRRVIVATERLLDETRKYEILVLANLQLARALVELGQYQQGLTAAADTLEIAKQARLVNLVGELKQIQLDLAMRLGDYRTANALAMEISESARARGDLESGLKHLLVVARTEKLLGRWDKLTEVLEQVNGQCVEAMNAYLAEAESLLYRSYLVSRADNPEDARGAISLAIRRAQLAEGVDSADMLITLADRWIEMDEADRATTLYETVVKGNAPPATKCWALLGLGKTRLISGEVESAQAPLAEAVRLFEHSRLTWSLSSFRALWSDRGAGIYETAIHRAFLSEQPERALQLMERSRARNFREHLHGQMITKEQGPDQRRLAEIEVELARRRQIRQDASILVRGTQSESLELDVEDIREEMDRREQALLVELNQLRARMSSVSSSQESVDALPEIQPSVLKESLGTEAVGLVYFIGKEHSYVSIVTADRLQTLELSADSAEVFKHVSDFRKAIESIGDQHLDYTPSLDWLSTRLLDPVVQNIPKKAVLVVVPHGPMHYLPFGALKLPGGDYLIVKHPVVVLPALGVLKHCREINRGRLESVLSVGNPSLHSSQWPALPFAETEARALSRLFAEQSTLLTGEQATETNVVEAFGDHDIIHLGTHGQLEARSPNNSALMFTRGPDDDGRLTVREIRELKLRANLIVLSACNTALGATESGRLGAPGDDLVGLSRAFMTAGAPSVVCSLWQVSDESTKDTMLTFYNHLRRGRNKAEALQLAQVAMMSRQVRLRVRNTEDGSVQAIMVSGDHPFIWAPFELFGDWH